MTERVRWVPRYGDGSPVAAGDVVVRVGAEDGDESGPIAVLALVEDCAGDVMALSEGFDGTVAVGPGDRFYRATVAEMVDGLEALLAGGEARDPGSLRDAAAAYARQIRRELAHEPR